MATALETLETLFRLPDAAGAKAEILAIADAAGLNATSFTAGEPTERWLEIAARAMDAWGRVPTQALRGMFLDIATDPGDPGDPSPDQTVRPGFLSALGLGWYGTLRAGELYATGFVTLTNVGSSPTSPFKPYDLTFQRNYAGADGGTPTYRNSSDPSIYAGFGGTLTLLAGASQVIPIVADQIGTYSNATPTTISVCVTQSFGSLTVVNAAAALGRAQESAATYRARCKLAAARLAVGGPQKAYLFAMNTAKDGTPLQRFDGSGPVGITRAYVSAASATGGVTIYYADPDGPADPIDVSSANANISGTTLDELTDPIGVLPDAVTLLPVTDPNTGGPGGDAATALTIPITGSCRIKARTGMTGAELIAAVQSAIVSAETSAFQAFDVGGVDEVSGAGVIYSTDIAGIARDAYAGLYDVILSKPSASSTAIPLGNVAVPNTFNALFITGAANNGSGLIRITAAGHGLTTGCTVVISGVVGTTEANNAPGVAWTVTVISSSQFDLQGSTFTHAYTSGGTISCWLVTVT